MNARTNVRTSVWEPVLPYALPALLVVGFLLRLASSMHPASMSTSARSKRGRSHWSTTASRISTPRPAFADYPPGYFYILALFGHMWAPFRHADPGYAILRVFVKLPAILADLGVGVLLYAIGKQLAPSARGLGAAALYLLSPATILISADWGQVDSVAGGLALLGVYFLLRSGEDAARALPAGLIPAAWLALAYSLLIKPQAAVLIAFFIAFAFAIARACASALIATAIGIVAALVLR